METEYVYPDKIYTSLKRACTYGRVLPNYVQPVYRQFSGVQWAVIGWSIGPSKRGQTWLTYREASK